MSNKVLRNFMEEYVLSRVDKYVNGLDCCKCSTCRLDIAAIVLNNMPPKYVVTNIGEVYARTNFLESQYEIDLITQITNAAKIVKEFPQHDR